MIGGFLDLEHLIQTKTLLTDVNLAQNMSKVNVCRLRNAKSVGCKWNNYDTIVWMKYQIKETDMRVKTATFTSPQYLDLTTGKYAVSIISPYHESFGGVILSVEYDESTGLYSYQCQDWSRSYQSKGSWILPGITLHRFLHSLLTFNNIHVTGSIPKSTLKSWKFQLSGLKPAYQYEQKYFGSRVNFNPMSEKINAVIHGKTFIEVIRDMVFGSGAYIDVYFDIYGVCHISPYHKDDFFNTGVTVNVDEVSSMKLKFDTTNIVTAVEVQSENNLKVGTVYKSNSLINLDLSSFFGGFDESVSNPNSSNSSGGAGVSTKKSVTTKNKNNPYGTKKKMVYLNSDNIYGKSTDRKFLKDIASKLKKKGWKTKVIGVGPNTHTEAYARKYRNGVWFCVYGGADGAVFRECVGKNSYTNTLKKNNLRTVIGMRAGCDIRKGGKCYKFLRRAHDDNYSPSSYRGISYPLSKLTKGKVPIMYAGTVDKMVAKFLAGGDNPKAC